YQQRVSDLLGSCESLGGASSRSSAAGICAKYDLEWTAGTGVESAPYAGSAYILRIVSRNPKRSKSSHDYVPYLPCFASQNTGGCMAASIKQTQMRRGIALAVVLFLCSTSTALAM